MQGNSTTLNKVNRFMCYETYFRGLSNSFDLAHNASIMTSIKRLKEKASTIINVENLMKVKDEENDEI